MTTVHESSTASAGALIRAWRMRRRMSQLDLALDADISQRHLSFLESGRSQPSRDMVIRLSDHLDVPLRERNRLLVAAGFAPGYADRGTTDPSFAPALAAIDLVLKGHEPNPAIAVDRHWNLVRGNGAIGPFLEGIEETSLLVAPVNVLRLSLHPGGLAPRIVNFAEWRSHILERLRRLARTTSDPAVADLEEELRALPSGGRATTRHDYSDIAVPLRVRQGDVTLSFISTITVFGTPLDVSLSELAIESFFAADAGTAAALRRMAEMRAAAIAAG